MISNSIDLDLLIAFIAGFSCLLFVAYLDRSLTRRRSLIANARYMMRHHAGRWDSRLHWMGAESWSTLNTQLAQLIIEPGIEIRTPGFFSRRRVVTDCLGRVVATHYEELALIDRTVNRLMLT